MSFSADDARFMARAIQLARRGLYTTDPNPRVGCVIARDGKMLGEGWHERAGLPHAEIARIMGREEGTIKANYFQAVRKLRKALEPYMRGEE